MLNLRAQRPTYVPDPRFTAVVNMIRSGAFGWEDYFAPICDAITKTDYYLVANDFAPYLDAQVGMSGARRGIRVKQGRNGGGEGV